MVRDFFIVGLSGFLGSIARYAVYLWYTSRHLTAFPWATLTVNVSGCLLIGFLSASNQRPLLLLIATGFIGAFTTFSAFGLETVNLLRAGQLGPALLNIGANLVLGIAAVLAGRLLG